MDGILTFADGEVKLGGADVPGILERLTIGCEVVFDEAEEDGKSGTTKTPMGWEDATISLVIVLVSDEESSCYDKLAKLNQTFKGYDKGSGPKVFTVANSHVSARGIDFVVFKRLESNEDNKSDVIVATLSFDEHNPPIQRVEQRGGGTTPSKNAKEPPLRIVGLGGR